LRRAHLMRAEDLTKTLELTSLDPGGGPDAVEAACEAARESHVASLCVLPEHLPVAVERLRGCDVKPAVAIDFPAGDHATADRVAAAQRAVADGAEQIDIVINHRLLLGGSFGAVRDDLVNVVRAVRARAANDGRGDAVVTVTLETPLLGEKLTRLACLIAEDAGVDFATTATGTSGPTTVSHVEVMRDALSEAVGVRAAGGIVTLQEVQDLVSAGAVRVATDRAAQLLAELAAANGSGR
jgi:deoxyribose-phosphate aldolase